MPARPRGGDNGGMAEPLTDGETRILRDGAYGAIALVANAEPGLLDLVRESFAASKVLVSSSGVVRAALTTGDLPELPRSPEQLEARVLPALRRAVAVLKVKAPAEVDRYRSTVLEACDRAAAEHGVVTAESQALSRIRSALGE